MNKTLYIIRGIPGSGKSTLAKKLAERLGTENHYEADMWFETNGGFDPKKLKDAHQWCREMVEIAMGKGEPCILSNTSTQEWEMTPYKDHAELYGYKVVQTTMRTNYGSIHRVPQSTIEAMQSRFEDQFGEVEPDELLK